MSEYNFITGQPVLVKTSHNHIEADATVYTVGSIDRISGSVSVQLLKDGRACGAVPQSKLQASK